MYYDRDRGRLIEVLNPYTMETYKAIYMMGLLGTSKVVIVAVDTHDGHVEYPELRLSSISNNGKRGLTYYANPFDGLDIVWNKTIMTYCHEFISQKEYNYVMMHVIRCIEGDNYTYDEGANSFKNSDLCHTRYGTPAPAGTLEDKTNPYDDHVCDIVVTKTSTTEPKLCPHFDIPRGEPTVEYRPDGTIICTSCGATVSENEVFNSIHFALSMDPIKHKEVITRLYRQKCKAIGPDFPPEKCRHTFINGVTAIEPDEDQNMHCLRCGQTFKTAEILHKFFLTDSMISPDLCPHAGGVPKRPAGIKLRDGTYVCGLCGSIVASPVNPADAYDIEDLDASTEYIPTEGLPIRDPMDVFNEEKVQDLEPVEEQPAEEVVKPDTGRSHHRVKATPKNKKTEYEINVEKISSVIRERFENFTPATKGVGIVEIVKRYMEMFPEYVFMDRYICLTRLYNLNRGYMREPADYAPAKFIRIRKSHPNKVPQGCFTPEECDIMYKFDVRNLCDYEFDSGKLTTPVINMSKAALRWMVTGVTAIKSSPNLRVVEQVKKDGERYRKNGITPPPVTPYVDSILDKFPEASRASVQALYYRHILGKNKKNGYGEVTSTPERINWMLGNHTVSKLVPDIRNDVLNIINTVDGKYDAVVDGSLDLHTISDNKMAVMMAYLVILKSAYNPSIEKVSMHPTMVPFISYIGSNYPIIEDFFTRLYYADDMIFRERDTVKRLVFSPCMGIYCLHQSLMVLYHMSNPDIFNELTTLVDNKDYIGFAKCVRTKFSGVRADMLFGKRCNSSGEVLFACLDMPTVKRTEFYETGKTLYPIPRGNTGWIKDMKEKREQAKKEWGL